MANRSIEPYRDERLPDRFMRWIETLRMRIATIPCYTESTGSPEGVVAGIAGDRYYDLTNFLLYIKSTNTGLTGWLQVGGGAGGIPSRRNLMGSGSLRSDLTDTSINFTAASYDVKNSRGLIGGNTSFCGSMADLKSGKVAEFATLPSTVIGAGSITEIQYNGVDSGVLVRVGNVHARAPTAGTPWTAITPPFGVSYGGFMSWNDVQLIAGHTSVGAGDYTVSTDNGATWPAQFAMATKGGSILGMSKTPTDSKLLAYGGNNEIAWTASADLTAAIWNSFALNTLISTTGNTADFDWNLDGSKGVGITTTGDVFTTIDGGFTWVRFDRDLNIFRNAGSQTVTDYCVFVDDLNGWIMGDTNRGAFISNAGNLDSMTMVNYAMISSIGITDRCRVTDGIDLLLPASINTAGMLIARS